LRDREAPREISALESSTGGSVAWIATKDGELITAIVFDGKFIAPENDWKVRRVSDVVYFATPTRRVTLTETHPERDPGARASQLVEKIPHPLAAPTHTLSERAQDDLKAWLGIADKGGLFSEDPTFSGSAEATAILDALRRAAKGEALNSKTFRSLKKL
jgi:hypothetical protein